MRSITQRTITDRILDIRQDRQGVAVAGKVRQGVVVVLRLLSQTCALVRHASYPVHADLGFLSMECRSGGAAAAMPFAALVAPASGFWATSGWTKRRQGNPWRIKPASDLS
jgi:hypothetical protein